MNKKAVTFLDFQSIFRDGGINTSPIPFIYDILNNTSTLQYWRRAKAGDTTDYIAVFDRVISKDRYDVDPSHKNAIRAEIQEAYLDASATTASIIGAFGIHYILAGIHESADVIASNVVGASYIDKYDEVNVLTADLKMLQLITYSPKVDIFFFGRGSIIEKPTGFNLKETASIIPYYLAIKGYPYDTISGLGIPSDELMKFVTRAYTASLEADKLEPLMRDMYSASRLVLERNEFDRLYNNNLKKLKLYVGCDDKICKATPDLGTVWKWCQYHTFSMAQENDGVEVDRLTYENAKDLFKFFSGSSK